MSQLRLVSVTASFRLAKTTGVNSACSRAHRCCCTTCVCHAFRAYVNTQLSLEMAKTKKTHKDFQKVKLKVGRKLPKGLNVTDTSFKTKKIVLHDRLSKSTGGEPTTARKLSVQDLIGRLHHYNVTNRLSALAGLRELGRSHSVAFGPHLKPLLEILGTLCSDKEGVVRQSAHKVLRLVLGSVSSERLSPFGPLLLSHLGCAVNHLSSEVRHDALELLSMLLDTVPALAVRAPYGTLHNFLNMVSASAESSVSKRRRVLSCQPGQRHTNRVVWMRVLSCMERFLTEALRIWFPAAPASADDGDSSDTVAANKTVWLNPECPGVALYRSGLEPRPQASALRLYDGLLSVGTGSGGGGAGSSTGRDSAREFALELVPLLLDMWVEADPDSGESMQRDSLALVYSILRVLLLLIEWLRKENPSNVPWFEEQFGPQLLSHFEGRFPFSHDCVAGVQPVAKKAKRDVVLDRQVSVTSINLCMCEVLAGLLGVLSPDQSDQVLVFFGDLISSGQVRSGDVRVVVKIGQLLLPRVSSSECERLADAILSLYEEGDVLQPRDEHFVLDFFHKLILGSPSLLEVVQPVVDRFLTLLPERVLVGPDSQEGGPPLRLLGKLSTLRLPVLLSSLQPCSLICIELLSQLSDGEDQRTMVEVICRVPCLERDHFEALYAATLSPLPTPTLLYLLQLLRERFDECKSDSLYVAAYSSFLLSVATGVSQSVGNHAKTVWTDDSSWLELKELLPEVSQLAVVPIDWDALPRHLAVAEVVAKSLEAFPSSWDMTQIFEPFLHQLIEAYPHLPCSAALALVHLAGRRRSVQQVPWLLAPPWGPLMVGLAAGLLCVAAQLAATLPRALPAVLRAIAAMIARCPSLCDDLIGLLCPTLELSLSASSHELVCGALRLLRKQGVLSVPARNHAVKILAAAGKQGSELRRYTWFMATLGELIEGPPPPTSGPQPRNVAVTVQQ